MGHHADFTASLLLGPRNDHVGPHSSQLTEFSLLQSEVGWQSSQRSLTACIISTPLIGDSETSQVSPPSPASHGVMQALDCSSTITHYNNKG